MVRIPFVLEIRCNIKEKFDAITEHNCYYVSFWVAHVYICRQMKSLDDDICSFGFILLESLIGPSVLARKESFLLNEMVSELYENRYSSIVANVLNLVVVLYI